MYVWISLKKGRRFFIDESVTHGRNQRENRVHIGAVSQLLPAARGHLEKGRTLWSLRQDGNLSRSFGGLAAKA